MRRFVFFILIILIVIIIARRRTRIKQTRKLLIEDICQSFEKEYRESQKEQSIGFWLTRLRQVRKRYGDGIAKEVALKLKNRLKEKNS